MSEFTDTVEPAKVDENHVKNVNKLAVLDITEEFFLACKRLNEGQLARTPGFDLLQSMSAIELMDPKMDTGMIPLDNTLGLKRGIELGKINPKEMPVDEQIAIFDATMACYVCWVQGEHPDFTVFTNVCLQDPGILEDVTLRGISAGLLHLVHVTRFVVELAMIHCEEDFVQVCYSDSRQLSEEMGNVPALKEAISHLAAIKKRDPATTALLTRLRFLQHLFEAFRVLIPSAQSCQPDSEDAFTVNFRQALITLPIILNIFEQVKATVGEGRQPPNGTGDGDYSWLTVIQPDVNKHLNPATFPKIPAIKTRIDAYEYLGKDLAKLKDVICDIQLKTGTIEELLNYVRKITEEGEDILIRSVLQIVIIPFNDNVFGNIPLSGIIANSIQNCSAPFIMDKNYQIHTDTEMQGTWRALLTVCTKSFSAVIQHYGFNLVRQRERLHSILEELLALYWESERVDRLFYEVTAISSGLDYARAKTCSLATYFSYQILEILKYSYAMSFKLQLFVPYEFQYVYWYYGSIILVWQYKLLQQSKSYILAELHMVPPSHDKKKYDRKMKAKEGIIRRRIDDLEVAMTLNKIECCLCECFTYVNAGLVAGGQLDIPDNEQNRYSLRFEPFLHAPSFLRMTYAQYLELSRFHILIGRPPKDLFAEAAKACSDALKYARNLTNAGKSIPWLDAVTPVLKKNLVICRLLSAAPEKRVDYEFSEVNFLYPLLKLA